MYVEMSTGVVISDKGIEVEGNAYFLSFKDKSNDDVMILRSVA